MGSILTTPNQRKSYTKSGSSRMKISGKNTWKREVDYGIRQAKEGKAEAQGVINSFNAKKKRPLVFVGEKQWNEYQNFNKRKRYND